MFHLSLPVANFSECLDFYRYCFGAEVVMLSDRAANLFVFDGQLTFHDKPGSALTDLHRQEMHFGHVVSHERWFAIRDRIIEGGYAPVKCVVPQDAANGRGKLLVRDPGGNIVEINSGLPPARGG